MMRRIVRAIQLAFAFLTIIPIPLPAGEVDESDLRGSRFAYPFVGLVLGTIVALASLGLARIHAPGLLSAAILVALASGLTGFLHLDGVADSGDGIFLSGAPYRRLEAMRDPHVGSFGVTVLILVLMLKIAALSAIDATIRSPVLLISMVVSRLLILVVAGLGSSARSEGMGKVIIDATTRTQAIVACLIALSLGSLMGWPLGLAASLAALTVVLGLMGLARARLGGITGDILGAGVEFSECGFWVAAALLFAAAI